MAKRWRIHPHDPDRIAALAAGGRHPGRRGPVAHLPRRSPIRRSPGRFSIPSSRPSAIPSCCPAAARPPERIHAAIAARRRIVIYGDYDVDGMTGTAILWLCLKLLGGRGQLLRAAPHRRRLRPERRGRAHAGGRGRAALIVTVDCGIASVDEAALARRAGPRTDHHRPSRAGPAAARGRGHRPSAPARHGAIRSAD